MDALRTALEAFRHPAADSAYILHLKTSEELSAILEDRNQTIWSRDVQVLSDSPEKADRLRRGESTATLAALTERFASAERSLRIMSPYFVPGRKGTELLTERHAHELKRLGSAAVPLGVSGSSGASLHTKAAVIDNAYVFVGSFNLDPRSAWLNCEMGVMVCSPELARALSAIFDDHTDPAMSYRVSLNAGRQLRWTHARSRHQETLSGEPEASFSRRALAILARVLPLQRQL